MKKITLILTVFFAVAFLAGCTVDYNPETEETHTEAEEITEEITEKEELIPLLFEDTEKNISLYRIKPEGIILYTDGYGRFYNWKHTPDENHPPQVFTGNFDGDYKEDIAVVLFDGTDGNNAEDLYFLSDGKFDEDHTYKVNTSELKSYTSYIVESNFSNNAISFTSGDISYSFDLSESFSKLAFDGISYTDNVSYEFEDGKIYVNIIPTVKSADENGDYGKINLDITIRAKLNFDGYNISLSSPTLKPHI